MLWNPGDISKLDAHWHTEFWLNFSPKCTQLAFPLNFDDRTQFSDMICNKEKQVKLPELSYLFFSFGQSFGACKLVLVFPHHMSLFDTNNLNSLSMDDNIFLIPDFFSDLVLRILVQVFPHHMSLFDTNNLEPKFSVDG